jgi:hypothetical protein
MKFIAIMALALVATQGMRIQESHVDGKEIALIVQGFLEGTFEGSFPVHECIADAEEMIQDFENAYFFFKKGITVTNVGDALKQIGAAVKKLPPALRECKSCVGIISKIETLSALFVNPARFLEKVGKNIIWHFKDITGDIHQARDDWEAGLYKEFGEFCGKIVAVALSSPNPLSKPTFGPTDAARFFEGFFETAAGPTGDITQCITNSERLSSLVQALASEFSDFGLDAIMNIVTDLKDILELVPTEFATCTAVPKEALHIVAAWSSEFTHPVDVSKKIVKAMWSSHSELIKDTKDFVSNVGQGSYRPAGENLADFLILILGRPQ